MDLPCPGRTTQPIKEGKKKDGLQRASTKLALAPHPHPPLTSAARRPSRKKGMCTEAQVVVRQQVLENSCLPCRRGNAISGSGGGQWGGTEECCVLMGTHRAAGGQR